MSEVSTMTTTIETLPAVECAPWCTYGDGHTKETRRDEQICYGDQYVVKLTRMPLEVNWPKDGPRQQWLDDVRVYLQRENEGQAHVYLGHGEKDGGVEMALSEVRELRDALNEILTAAGA